jgi:hypothetical protein
MELVVNDSQDLERQIILRSLMALFFIKSPQFSLKYAQQALQLASEVVVYDRDTSLKHRTTLIAAIVFIRNGNYKQA